MTTISLTPLEDRILDRYGWMFRLGSQVSMGGAKMV